MASLSDAGNVWPGLNQPIGDGSRSAVYSEVSCHERTPLRRSAA